MKTQILSVTSKVIQGHIRPLFCPDRSSTFIYGPIFLKICMNANIMKAQFFRSYGQLLSLFYFFSHKKVEGLFDVGTMYILQIIVILRIYIFSR